MVDVNQPERPRLIGELADGFLKNPKCIAIQFQYAFITDDEGLKVSIAAPGAPHAQPGAAVRLLIRTNSMSRTYASANGRGPPIMTSKS